MTRVVGNYSDDSIPPGLNQNRNTDLNKIYAGRNIKNTGPVASNKEKEIALEKLRQGIYVPLPTLKKYGLEHRFIPIAQAIQEAMKKEKTVFGKAKLVANANLTPPSSVTKVQPFPKKSLTRLITGDVKPEWLVGLGRMKEDKRTPQEGYKDVFVSSLEEYERKGIHFDPEQANDPVEMATKLDIKGTDFDKVKTHGAWLIEIHPSSKLAVPTERLNEWNPGYIEGGFTRSEQQEWVTPNVPLDQEIRAGNIKIFKIDNNGGTVEWKFFQGKLWPDYPPGSDGKLVEGSWRHAIDEHVKNARKPQV